MKNSSKWIIGLLVLLAIILLVKNQRSSVPTSSSSLKIGSILPLTGELASLGEEVNKGALIAVEEAKQQGINIEYLPEDDSFEAKKTVNAANKLINQNKVNIAFTMAVQELKPIAANFNQSQTPILTVWDSGDYITNAGPYIFSIGFNTEKTGAAMANYAYNILGLKTAAIIEQADEWSELISSAFTNEFKNLGGTIIINERFVKTEVDFRTVLAKSKAANVSAIYFPVNPPAGSRIIIQAKQTGFAGMLISADGLIQEEINAAGKAANGVYFTNIYTNNESELLKKYHNKYGSESGAPEFVAYGYDAINTIIAAQKISINKNISLPEALRQVNLKGASDIINFDGKQYSEKVEKIYRVQNGKPVEIVK